MQRGARFAVLSGSGGSHLVGGSGLSGSAGLAGSGLSDAVCLDPVCLMPSVWIQSV